MNVAQKQRRSSEFFSREFVIAYLVGFAFLSASFVLGLRWFEQVVTFHPIRYQEGEARRPDGATDVWLRTTDGVRLHGWFFQNNEQAPRASVIFFHGNGGNITNVGWVGERLATRDLDVLLLDYRGYGRSDGTAESEQAIYRDADAAYDFLLSRGVRPESIVLYGQSLGSTAAVDVASRRRCGALIIESGLSSASAMASATLPWLPRQLHFLTRNRFESARKLKSVKCPVLITHGDPDDTIPTEQARALYAAANEPRRLIIFAGAGHNVFGTEGEKYLKVLSEFVKDAVGK